MINKVSTFFDRAIDVLAAIAGFFVVFLMVYVSADVAIRNVFNVTLPYTIDISEILLLYITFLVAAYVQKREGHVRMDFVFNQFGPKNQALINTITSIVVIIICMVLTWYSAAVALDLFERGIYTQTVLAFPKAAIMAVIPVGFFLLFIQLLISTNGYIRTWQALRQAVPYSKVTDTKTEIIHKDMV